MDLRRYDLNLLVTLEALLEEESVTDAARRLNLSQSAVSAALDRLRAVFSDPLLVRVGNRMEPTPFARRLQGPIKTALASVSLALALPQKFDPARARAAVRLGTSDYFGLLMLPALYKLLAREAPGISLEVLARPADGSIARLVAGDVDLALAVEPPEGRDLFNAPLVDEQFVCVMRRGHPLAGGRLTPGRLVDYPHVVVTAHGESTTLVDRALAAEGHRRQAPVRVPVFATAFALLADNDLVAILPERISRAQAARFGLVVRKPPVGLPGYTLSIAWHQRTAHDPVHRWVREQVLAIAGSPAGHRRHK
jgi:DNA-binding transcriptional LysR family regulator